jgi:hypothetical protein
MDQTKTLSGAIRAAIEIYLREAYGAQPPPQARKFTPPPGEFDPADWLMGYQVERTPSAASFAEVRSFCLRIGCSHYRHLKLRLSRPGKGPELVFTVDAHDSFFEAEPGSPDYEGVQQLRRHNMEIASRIDAAWEAAGLLTEKAYLRESIRRASAAKRESHVEAVASRRPADPHS